MNQPLLPVRPPKSLMRPVGRAMADYAMLEDGDRVLVGLSGGKDSLALLHILRHLQSYAPLQFELGAVTVDPLIDGFAPGSLRAYLKALDIPYFYVEDDLMEKAEQRMKNNSFCAFCARMKRGIIYRVAREQAYGVVALAQHLDDLAESFLMSAFHEGRLNTMKAHYRIDEGDLRVIRPLVYVRERQTAAFAAAAELPVVPDSCPACFSAPTQRAYMKTLLAREERQNRQLFGNLLNAMRPLLEGQPRADRPDRA